MTRTEAVQQIEQGQRLPVRSRSSVRRALFPSAIAVANTAIFLFQIMVARITTPALFGEVVAVLGLLLIIEAPASTIQAVMARAVQRRVSSLDGEPALDLGPLVAVALVAGLAACAVLAVLMPAIGRLLRAPHPPYLVAFYAIPVMLGVVPKGVLIGLGDFKSVSIGLVGSAIVRLVAGTALLHAGFGLSGAVAAVVIGEIFAGAVLLVAAHRKTHPGGGNGLDFAWRDALGEGMVFTGFWLLTGIDVVMARHYLPAARAGEYAAAATLAQIIMIAPGAAAAFLFPRVTGDRLRGRTVASRLSRALLGVMALSLALAGLVQILATPLLRTVFDKQYLGASSVTALLLVSAASLGVVTVLLQFLLARQESLPAALPWVGVTGFVVAAVAAHATMTTLAAETLAATAGTGLVMLAVAIHGCRYLRSESDPSVDMGQLDAALDLTIVVPYYNPGQTLAPNVRRLLTVLEQSPVEFEVIAVSDGSTDGSELTITDMEGDRLRHVILPSNQGKGAALRVGLSAGRGRYLGFIDADGDLDPKLLESFMTLVSLYQPDVVIGSKRHPLSEVHYPPLRSLYSIGYQYLIKLLFRLNVRDTQTGIKLIRRDVLSATLPRMLEKRFAFDLELLVVARRLGHSRFLEAPVVLKHQFTSTVSVRSVWNTLLDTMAIFYRLRFLRTYDRELGVSEPLAIRPAFIRR